MGPSPAEDRVLVLRLLPESWVQVWLWGSSGQTWPGTGSPPILTNDMMSYFFSCSTRSNEQSMTNPKQPNRPHPVISRDCGVNR